MRHETTGRHRSDDGHAADAEEHTSRRRLSVPPVGHAPRYNPNVLYDEKPPRHGTVATESEREEAQQKDKRVVSALVTFQQLDGSFAFDFPNLASLREAVGDEFTRVVKAVYVVVDTTAMALKRPELVAGTLATLMLFETRLKDYRSLWVLIAQKAKEWIAQNFKPKADDPQSKERLDRIVEVTKNIKLSEPTKGTPFSQISERTK